jgi:hypothetical protein
MVQDDKKDRWELIVLGNDRNFERMLPTNPV